MITVSYATFFIGLAVIMLMEAVYLASILVPDEG